MTAEWSQNKRGPADQAVLAWHAWWYEWSENAQAAIATTRRHTILEVLASNTRHKRNNPDAYTMALLKLYSSIIVCFALHVSTSCR